MQLTEFYYSMLWPSKEHQGFIVEDETIVDLNIDEIIGSMKLANKELPLFLKVVPTEVEVINYRQGLLKEFVEAPKLFEAVYGAITTCHDLYKRGKFAYESEANLYNLIRRVEEAAKMMRIFEGLLEKMSEAPYRSEGIVALKGLLERVIHHPLYESFQKDAVKITGMTQGVQSLKLGMNVDKNLQPTSAMLISIHAQPYKYPLFVPRKLFLSLTNLEKMMEPAMKQLIIFCDQFIDVLITTLANLKSELPFFEMGIHMHTKLIQAGLGVSQPVVNENDGTTLQGAYNINLAFEKLLKNPSKITDITCNNLTIDTKGNLFILTGANRGGKTTFTQAVGQCFWLGQLGFYVPAQAATLQCIDGLFVHFPREESQTDQHGRLGDECNRFSEIFEHLTPKSLLLMNESFAGTSHLESFTIAIEAVKALKKLGATLLFNTHLHELGHRVEQINTEDPLTPTLISLVAGTESGQRTYEVQQGPPLGQSYARDIALKYGMTFEQLIET